MRIGLIFRSLGALLVLLGILSLFTFSSISTELQRFAETNVAADGELSSTSEVRITISVIYIAAMIIFLGGIFVAARKASVRAFLLRIMQINPQSKFERPPRMLVFSALITSVLVSAYMVRIFNPRLDPMYTEGGFFESLTAIALGISSLFVLRALRSYVRNSKQSELSFALTFFYGALALGFFLLAMEEISWGQRLIGWETPPFLARINLQGETNLHNIVNDFALLYYPLAFLLPLVLLSGWLRTQVDSPIFLLKILPPPNTFFTAAFISVLSFLAVGINELVEELFALFALTYSAQLYLVESQESSFGTRFIAEPARKQ